MIVHNFFPQFLQKKVAWLFSPVVKSALPQQSFLFSACLTTPAVQTQASPSPQAVKLTLLISLVVLKLTLTIPRPLAVV